MKITVKEANKGKGPQKVKVKFSEKLKTTLSLIEALRILDKPDFNKVVQVAKRLRLSDWIADRALRRVNE